MSSEVAEAFFNEGDFEKLMPFDEREFEVTQDGVTIGLSKSIKVTIKPARDVNYKCLGQIMKDKLFQMRLG